MRKNMQKKNELWKRELRKKRDYKFQWMTEYMGNVSTHTHTCYLSHIYCEWGGGRCKALTCTYDIWFVAVERVVHKRENEHKKVHYYLHNWVVWRGEWGEKKSVTAYFYRIVNTPKSERSKPYQRPKKNSRNVKIVYLIENPEMNWEKYVASGWNTFVNCLQLDLLRAWFIGTKKNVNM